MLEVGGVRQHGELLWGEVEFALEFFSHGSGLADDGVGTAVREAIGVACEAVVRMCGDCCGEFSVLAGDDSSSSWEERAEVENEQIEMGYAAEDHAGAEPPDEEEQLRCAAANSTCSKVVHGNGSRK